MRNVGRWKDQEGELELRITDEGERLGGGGISESEEEQIG